MSTAPVRIPTAAPMASRLSRHRHMGSVLRLAVPMRLLAGIVFAVGIGGATALASTPIAGATVGPTINPTLSVSPTSGPVGSVVTVTFGPSDDGCGGVGFGSSAVPTGAFLPLLDRGSQHFVIPATIGGPAPA